jgi:hypothetical protein
MADEPILDVVVEGWSLLGQLRELAGLCAIQHVNPTARDALDESISSLSRFVESAARKWENYEPLG